MADTDESSSVSNEIKTEKPVECDSAESGQQDVEMKELDNSNSPVNHNASAINGVKKEEDIDEKPANSSGSVKNETATDEEMSDEAEDEEMEDAEISEEKPKETIIVRENPKILYQEPLFAEICSFFNLFGSAMGVKYSIEHLERLLCTHVNGKPDPALVELHLFLMRRVRLNWARSDKFDQCLKRYCEICPSLDAEELELLRFDYVDLPMSAKLTILKALCESQFDYNYKFKETIFHTYSSFEQRLSPIGYDKNGCAFYYQQDYELSIRVYSFELDDLSGASWTLQAKSAKELYKLIQHLKSPDYGTQKESSDDEDKIVEGVVRSESKEEENDSSDVSNLVIEMSDAERQQIQLVTKKSTLWDVFRTEDELNKKQKLKEERKKAKLTAPEVEKPKKVPVQQEEDVESIKSDKKSDIEDEEPDLTEFMDDRRVLPRRNARNVAITNLKQFTTPNRKRAEPKQKPDEKPESDDQDEQEDEEASDIDESDEEDLGSSDGEFVVKSRKRKGRKRKAGSKPQKPRSLIPRKQKPKPVAFEESSSDEDEEEVAKKERKKANEKTLCMHCKKSTRPDVLLLCDSCDDAWHTFCLKPQLHFVPDGDWFCPVCHHKMLIQNLSFAFIQLREKQQIKEEEARRLALEIERLNRERRHRGIDLNNIITTKRHQSPEQPTTEEEEIDDGQRKSKRKALKKVLTRTRDHYQREYYAGPIATIAESRTKRNLNKVDYKFQEFDDQLQEAIDAIDSPPAQAPYERTCGLGLGKDMKNILQHEERRGSMEEESGNASQENENGETEPKVRNPPARPPTKKTKKSKLTDLDLDNVTESETDEYNASSDEEREKEQESSASTEEYVPSDSERRRGRGGTGRGAAYYTRTRSDDEFINDDSDSDFEPGKRKGRGGALNRKRNNGARNRGGRKAKRGRRWESSDEEETEESYQEESGSSEDERKRKSAKKSTTTASKPSKKWGPKESSAESQESESEEVEMDEQESDASGPTTQSGRPLRKAAKEMEAKIEKLEKQAEEIDREVEASGDEENPEIDSTKIIGQPRRPTKKIVDDDEDEFEPEPEENPSSDESEEQIEEELAKELKEKKQKQKRHIESDEESDSEQSKFVEKQAPTRKSPVKTRPSPVQPVIRQPLRKSSSTDVSASKAKMKRQETQESERIPTPPEDPAPMVLKRSGRRKSDAPPVTKPTPKPTPAKKSRIVQQSPSTSTPNTSQGVKILPKQQSLPSHHVQMETMRPMQNIHYVQTPQTVAYALPPHIRPVHGVHYVQAPPQHMQPSYEYYAGPPPQYIAQAPHVYTQSGHIIAAPQNSYPVYASMPAYSESSDHPQVTQLQTMRPVIDPDSLGHALSGAMGMNPDVL